MNLASNIAAVTPYVNYSDDQLGGPFKRVMTKRSEVLNAMNLARRVPNATRYDRLAAFLAQWDVKCELLFMQERETETGIDSGVQLSLDLANDASAALAVND